ncbi:MAG: hypothetical protein K0S39_3411 [Paenibacillus sp.]|nr:hypothetical protein [Paenibacillus sp.]
MSFNEAFSEASIRELKNRFYLAVPLLILVPVLLWLLFHAAGYPLDWKAAVLGAAGWLIALILRGPIALLVMRLPQSKGQTILVASSGVLEEGVRFALLALTMTSLPWALSIGQGWAAIEVVYTVVTGFATLSLLGRTDEKAKQAQAILAAQGVGQSHPMWGVVERLFASLFHIGATLLLAHEPYLLALLIPLHSFLNLSAVILMKRSIVLVEAVIAVVGVSVMLGGWLTGS